MKVKCIDRAGNVYLTINKIYEVLGDDYSYYKIRNDDGVDNWYHHCLFVKQVEEKVSAGPPNCTKCGEHNSYQTGPFICYRCRS